MSKFRIPVSEFDEWLVGSLDPTERVLIKGGFRGPSGLGAATVPILEFRTLSADTARLLVPREPQVVAGKPPCNGFNGQKSDWWSAWAAVLVATGLVPPIIDPVRLTDLLQEDRRIRFCCDTNGLANGIAAWLLQVLDSRADIVTSAVVDRELAAWPDRYPNMWTAPSIEEWSRRTSYRLARRITETPPLGVVIDRLSPEQGALMLAKLRDETESRKSPDADMLLVELARGLIRDQPRNARVVYLTGDRNNARAAMNALGPENVLFAVADGEQAKRHQGSVVVRGWWRPSGPLGSVLIPAASRLIWDLLAPCQFLIIESGSRRWHVTVAVSVGNGVPSDWADPWLEIDASPATAVKPAIPKPIAVAPPEAGVTPGILPTETPRAVIIGIEGEADKTPNSSTSEEVPDTSGEKSPDEATGSGIAPPVGIELTGIQVHERNSTAVEASHLVSGQSETDLDPNDRRYRWLLPATRRESPISVSAGLRPSPKIFFHLICVALFQHDPAAPSVISPEIGDEVSRLLAALDVRNADGKAGMRANEYREAWLTNNLDWFHGELLRTPGYSSVLEELREDGTRDFGRRREVHLTMARALGQVAKLDRTPGALIVGDAPLAAQSLLDALHHWMPSPGDSVSTLDACRLAAKTLYLTPSRFQVAMQKLWSLREDVPFEGQTGGTVVPGPSENVVSLTEGGYAFLPIAPGALTFGRSGPVRFLVRTR